MKAWSKLNNDEKTVFIAKAMGWNVTEGTHYSGGEYCNICVEEPDGTFYPIPVERFSPTTDIKDTWKLLEHIKKNSELEIKFNDLLSKMVPFNRLKPLNICEAFLEAKGYTLE